MEKRGGAEIRTDRWRIAPSRRVNTLSTLLWRVASWERVQTSACVRRVLEDAETTESVSVASIFAARSMIPSDVTG